MASFTSHVVTSLIAAIVRDVRVALVTSASVAGSSYPAKTTSLVTSNCICYIYVRFILKNAQVNRTLFTVQ